MKFISPGKGKEDTMRRRHLPNIFEDLDEFCNAFSGCCSGPSCQKSTEGLSISEDEERLYIDAPLPGTKPEEVEVTIDQKKRQLQICGKNQNERENVKYHMKGSQCYCYEIPLSNEIDLDSKVEAVSKDGILRLTLPKNKGHKPLKVDVTVA